MKQFFVTLLGMWYTWKNILGVNLTATLEKN